MGSIILPDVALSAFFILFWMQRYCLAVDLAVLEYAVDGFVKIMRMCGIVNLEVADSYVAYRFFGITIKIYRVRSGMTRIDIADFEI